MAIDVTRDQEGLRQAVNELLERSFVEARTSSSLDSCDEATTERLFGSLPPLTLSPGYYKRADYLLWLDEQKKIGVLDPRFQLSEAEGLAAVAQARSQFERSHPPCGLCGALQDSPFSTSCVKCGTDFLKRSA